MPIEYIIETREGAAFSLNPADGETIRRGSMTQGDDILNLTYSKIQGQTVPGVQAIGPSRVNKRTLKIMLKIASDDSAVYLAQANRIMSMCSEAVKIASNFAEARVRCTRVGIKYGDGQLKIGEGDIEAIFDFLDPYWELSVPTVSRFTVPPGGILAVGDVVNGHVPVGPKLQLDAVKGKGIINEFAFFRNDTNQGIKVSDPDFGSSDRFMTYTVDCRAGTAVLGEQSRLSKVAPGSGFFEMPLTPKKLHVYNSGPGVVNGILTLPVLLYV